MTTDDYPPCAPLSDPGELFLAMSTVLALHGITHKPRTAKDPAPKPDDARAILCGVSDDVGLAERLYQERQRLSELKKPKAASESSFRAADFGLKLSLGQVPDSPAMSRKAYEEWFKFTWYPKNNKRGTLPTERTWGTTLIQDNYWAGPPSCAVWWFIEGDDWTDETLEVLDRCLERIVYFGRAESLTELRRWTDEPPAIVEVEYVDLPESGRKLIVLEARVRGEARPFTFNGRPFRRVETTTSRMPQERYESLLLDRMHARRRWENQPAVGVRIEDLDAEEILRTREDAVRRRRVSAGTSTDLGDILDRLGLRVDGVVTQAAQMLYGTRFLPDYPQARLKLGRFRGTKITGDILDNKQEYMHAFAMVREAMAFLDRTLPLSGHFVEGRIQREDRLPVPPDALREILLNAVMHRDYSDPGGDVAVAVFDDRIEIQSSGTLPSGITAAMLSGPHESILRNPLIAGAFHRTGAVEVGGRGTNRVIEECVRWGVEPPSFEVVTGSLWVTFRAAIGPGGPTTPQVTPQVTPQATPQAMAILRAALTPQTRAELQRAAGLKDREHFRKGHLGPLLDAGLLEMTVPDRPTSAQQRYRTTAAGRRALSES